MSWEMPNHFEVDVLIRGRPMSEALPHYGVRVETMTLKWFAPSQEVAMREIGERGFYRRDVYHAPASILMVRPMWDEPEVAP